MSKEENFIKLIETNPISGNDITTSDITAYELLFREIKEKGLTTNPKLNNGEKVIKHIQSSNQAQKLVTGKESYNAHELYSKKLEELPKLLSPFLQKVGLASLVGTSDGGKSTFLRQLCLSIVLKLDKFLEYKINAKHHRIIYVSTEDDINSVSFVLKKQIDNMVEVNGDIDFELLKNFEIIFEYPDNELASMLYDKIKKKPVDLIVIDAFSDVFTKDLNSNTHVRQFLNTFSKLANQFNCLILFLHHIGKRTDKIKPSKDNVIGSQAFEAKMRVVLELRPRKYNSNEKELWVLKSNFLESEYKKKCHVLEMTRDLTFKSTGERGSNQSGYKSSNPDVTNKVIELHKKGLSFRKIEKELKSTEFEVSKTMANKIIKKEGNNATKEKEGNNPSMRVLDSNKGI